MERHIRVSQLISIVFTKPDNVYSNRFSELIPLSSRGIKYTRPEVESIPNVPRLKKLKITLSIQSGKMFDSR